MLGISAAGFGKLIGIFIAIGFLLYLPLKSHRNRIFGFWDAIVFYCCIGAPILFYVMYFTDSPTKHRRNNLYGNHLYCKHYHRIGNLGFMLEQMRQYI